MVECQMCEDTSYIWMPVTTDVSNIRRGYVTDNGEVEYETVPVLTRHGGLDACLQCTQIAESLYVANYKKKEAA